MKFFWLFIDVILIGGALLSIILGKGKVMDYFEIWTALLIGIADLARRISKK